MEGYTSNDAFFESLDGPRIVAVLAALLPNLFGSASSKNTLYYQRTNIVSESVCSENRPCLFSHATSLNTVRDFAG